MSLGDYSRLFAALRRENWESLRALPWQKEVLPGEAVAATFSDESGLLSIAGAMPFLTTTSRSLPPDGNYLYLKSETLAQYLAENRALLRSYLIQAQNFPESIEKPSAHIAHVTSEIKGMEAANFAIFLAAQTSRKHGKTLLIDADPNNQFVFPLLELPEEPHVLTEVLQKPATFKADLAKATVTLDPSLAYLNMQATSLRPFDDVEISRICGFLDADFDNIVVYAGKMRSAWLSANANTSYAVCADSYRSELAAVLRHARGFSTVLLKSGTEQFLPRLGEYFGEKHSLAEWRAEHSTIAVLREFILRHQRAKHLVIGGNENLEGRLHCHTGFELYAQAAGLEYTNAESAINDLQNRLRPYYPKKAFYSPASVLRRMRSLPKRVCTAIVEVGDEPQLVSNFDSPELKAAAIFPAGIYPAINADGVRISACSAHRLERFKILSTRSGFQTVRSLPRYRIQKPNALAAVLEQIQA